MFIDLKKIATTMVATFKKDEAKVKAFIQKAVPLLKTIAVDAKDILSGIKPPPTGNKELDDFIAVLVVLAPYYKTLGIEAELVAILNDIITYLNDVQEYVG